MELNRITSLALFGICLMLCPPSRAASAQTAPPTPRAPVDDILQMSPFTVSTDRDVGYQAEDTLAGSRLNTRLRDTAASVSVFTRDFLNDLGITDLRELVPYSVNTELNTNENTISTSQNPIVSAASLTTPILVRGLTASQGMDYFPSITPSDPYRVGRYEDSRGPNSILFGIGAPGGLLNESSRTATTLRDASEVRYSVGSWDRHRLELHGNKVMLPDRLAMSVAALHQENGGWRAFDFSDKKRIFGSVTFRPLPQVTITAMGETGRDLAAVIRSTVEADEALAWYDNRQARGVNAVTFDPINAPTPQMIALGVTTRNGARGGTNHRAVFIENDRTIFDAIGTLLTGSYNNSAVRAPDGTPGTTAGVIRVNDAQLYPPDRDINASGPGMFRQQKLKNFTITADWQVTRNLALNLAHNYQSTEAVVTLMQGNDPTLRGDANRTLGVNGRPNPYAGRLYFDGNWMRDVHAGDVRETRLSASYALEPKSTWLGRHRIAGLLSRSKKFDARANSWLVLAGRPFNDAPDHANNRLAVRNYITEGSYATYRVGDFRSLPPQVTFDGRTYGLVFANVAGGGGGDQEAKSTLGVVQSRWLDGKFVTTLGVREDIVDVVEFGTRQDPLVGEVLDRDRGKATFTSATGHTSTGGIVYHAFGWLSLTANHSSNRGVPASFRRIFPNGNAAPSSQGKGSDYGFEIRLLDGRLNLKLVSFKSVEKGRIDGTAFGDASGRNTRVMSAFATALVGPGRSFTSTQWGPVYEKYTPPANNSSSDFDSQGYEARMVANLTRNWRLVANYSYTDSRPTNVAEEIVSWYGLTQRTGTGLTQGVRQDASGRFVVDRDAFTASGTVAKWIELGAMQPAANLSTLTTSTGQTIAQEILALVDTMNDLKQRNEKRYGLRPHKVSLFAAYDFKSERLRGFTIGGGGWWRSSNVIGTNSQGQELTGKVLTAVDLMLAHERTFARLPGKLRLQINVSNLLDRTDIIPARLATSDAAPNGFMLPGGRGPALSRYDLVAPRELRFTSVWSY